MDIVEAINKRQSIRAFKPDPVPHEILVKVMDAAIRAPSWSNSQTWEFAMLGGKVIAEIKEALYSKAVEQGEGGAFMGHMDIPYTPTGEPYRERSRGFGRLMYESQGIERSDRERRREFGLQNSLFFGASNGIIIYQDRDLSAWSVFDAGLAVQTIALAAVEYGLGTCIQATLVGYPEVLRQILGIPDSKRIVIGMSIGYPDWSHPVNNFRSPRAPIEEVVTWHDC